MNTRPRTVVAALLVVALSIPSFLSAEEITRDPSSTGLKNPGEELALRRIMKRLGQDLEAASRAMKNRNWGRLKAAAERIANHPQPPFSEKVKILGFIGGEAGQFKAFDQQVHVSATNLADAANRSDYLVVQKAFFEVQQACFECHQRYRERFRSHFYGQ